MNKYLSLLVIIFIFTACEIEFPEQWETPKWQLPLTIPLIDNTYYLSDISSEQNEIQIDSSNQTFVISIDTTLLDSGEIVIEETYFQVPSLASISDNFSFIIPSEIIPEIESQSFSITLEEIMQDDNMISPDCLPYQSTEIMDINFNSGNIPTYDNVPLDEYFVTNVYDVTIGEGSIVISITNEFPFEIEESIFTFMNSSNSMVWKTSTINNILPGDTKSDIINLNNESIPPNIALSIEAEVNDEEPIVDEDECSIYFVIEGIDDPIACNMSGNEWLNGQCVSDTGEDGWPISGSEYLDISVDFNLNQLESITVDLEYSKDTTIIEPFEVEEGIGLIEAKLSDIQNQDTNKVTFNLVNSLFTDLNMDIIINEFYGVDGEKYQKNIIVDEGEILSDSDDLSNFVIKNETGLKVEEITIDTEIQFSGSNTTLLFDYDYSFEITSIDVSALQLNELSVELDNFSTPQIDMATMPAGLTEIGLPTLQFHINLYNQIDAPLTLMLDIVGTTGLETTTIHAEPKLRYPYGYTGIDTTYIDIFLDTLLVKGNNFEDIYILDSPISDLFSKDNIQVGGYAILDGDANLEPGKSLWGDVEIEIRPLTLVLGENSVLIPQEITSLDLDESTKEEIESTLVDAELFLEVTNNMPLGADIHLLASNSTYFPLCFDSLVTGPLNIQTVSATCSDLIDANLNPDSIFVATLVDSSTYYMKFINAVDTVIIGKLIKLGLDAPTDLDENGFVIQGVVSYDTAELDSLELSWISKYETLNLSPMINNLSTSIDSLPGWITFHTTDNLRIRSFITFTINSEGVID